MRSTGGDTGELRGFSAATAWGWFTFYRWWGPAWRGYGKPHHSVPGGGRLPIVNSCIAAQDSFRIRLPAKIIHRDPLQSNATDRAPGLFLHLYRGELRSINNNVLALGAPEGSHHRLPRAVLNLFPTQQICAPAPALSIRLHPYPRHPQGEIARNRLARVSR